MRVQTTFNVVVLFHVLEAPPERSERGFFASGPGGAEGERKASASAPGGNCRQHVDGHRLRIGLASELKSVPVINLVQRRLVGFDGFLEARGRVGDLVRYVAATMMFLSVFMAVSPSIQCFIPRWGSMRWLDHEGF
jgi:hypothetical protein